MLLEISGSDTVFRDATSMVDWLVVRFTTSSNAFNRCFWLRPAQCVSLTNDGELIGFQDLR